jgi:hypothetical protein
MEKTLEEKVDIVTKDLATLKEKIDVLFYNTVALDSLTKFMLLNQNQLVGDMASLNDVLTQITQMLEERLQPPNENDDESEYDGDDDDEDEPNGILN